ncbi:FAD-dependent oxidoreductase [Sphingobacterium shayense]|uniref:FAD-dependent oxidoreductase n=1 Tax=Sphingobacterium shayense TaxID=626343 RepID=UPI00155770A2|nr:FAD-dependent oxidoreductase [Sphingobacterium shayense]
MENNKGTAVVIGAGIAGLSSAFYLMKDGWDVTIIDKKSEIENCSYGNAGMLVPSHFTPMAAPGIVAQGIKWMFDSKSPFYVRPSLSWKLMDWGLKFLKHANRQHVDNNSKDLGALNLYSSRLYDELSSMEGFDFELQQNGIIMMYKTKEVQHEEQEMAFRARDLGLEVELLDAGQLQALEPNMKVEALGAAYYKCDGKLYPQKLMRQLIDSLKRGGVRLFDDVEVLDFKVSAGNVQEVVTSKGNFKADQFVLAPGAFLPNLSAKLGIKMPLMPGKGYSFMYTPEGQVGLNHAALLLEARVAVTPMNEKIRFSGTMELGTANDKINVNRVKGIVESIPDYYPELKIDYPQDKVWYGYRPCTPDGLPYLGRCRKISNLTVAAGGGMMGLSLGPAFGKTVADILSERSVPVEIMNFRPDRFDR